MKKMHIYIAIIFVFCVALVLGGLHAHMSWRGDQFFGVVRDTRKGFITITDKRVGERTIFLSNDTKILRGRTELGAVPLGAPVFVVGKAVDGNIQAILVRVMETEEEAKNRP